MDILQKAIKIIADDPNMQVPPKWQEDKIKEIKTTNPGYSQEQVNKAITQAWAVLPETEKSKAKSGQPTVSAPVSHLLNAIRIISADEGIGSSIGIESERLYKIVFGFSLGEELFVDPDSDWLTKAGRELETLLELPRKSIAFYSSYDERYIPAEITWWLSEKEFKKIHKVIDANIDNKLDAIHLDSGVNVYNISVEVGESGALDGDYEIFNYHNWDKLTNKQASHRSAAEEENVIYGVDEKNGIVYYQELSGKFQDNVVKYLYKLAVVDQKGDSLGDMNFGMYYKLTFDPPLRVAEDENNIWQEAAFIVKEDHKGIVSYENYLNEKEADRAWEDVKRRYETFLDEAAF